MWLTTGTGKGSCEKATNFGLPIKEGNFLTRKMSASFSRNLWFVQLLILLEKWLSEHKHKLV